ncbi:hypothetical protein [Novosphingobium sp. SG751A]|uniref:hypothetical protein n=1 Tax=Novosphingobium sp. SG751A TaxID=2587000 RepID=UPI0015579EAB|nr:hypothetical protein [Novosphingobium sp. SG751A]
MKIYKPQISDGDYPSVPIPDPAAGSPGHLSYETCRALFSPQAAARPKVLQQDRAEVGESFSVNAAALLAATMASTVPWLAQMHKCPLTDASGELTQGGLDIGPRKRSYEAPKRAFLPMG